MSLMPTAPLRPLAPPLAIAPLGVPSFRPPAFAGLSALLRPLRARSAWLMELIEKVGAAALLVGAVASAVAHHASPIAILFLAPNILVVALILLRRRAVEIGDRPLDWILPLAASVAPQLLVAVSAPTLAPAGVALGCMALGGLLSLASILSLGRSFGVFPANRGSSATAPTPWSAIPCTWATASGSSASSWPTPAPTTPPSSPWPSASRSGASSARSGSWPTIPCTSPTASA
jgi:hypothetical protein